jgi:hypothetical protein
MLVGRVLGGQQTPPEQPEYFVPPVSASRIEFNWDAMVRWDDILLSKQSPAPDIERWRSFVRPELDWFATERFMVGMRLGVEWSSDDNLTNDRRMDNYRSDNFWIDRAYIQASAGAFTFWGGIVPMPIRATEMLWDHDIQVPGAAVSYFHPFAPETGLTLTGGYFYGPQREHDHSHNGAFQAVLNLGPPGGVFVNWSESFWTFTNLDNTATHFIRQNTQGPPGQYASEFRLIDSLVTLTVPIGKVPATLSVDWVHNFGAIESEYSNGYEVALVVGQTGNPGNVQFFNVWQYIEQDAVLGAYNSDDWWFHTWYDGDRVGVAVTVLPQVVIRPSVVFQHRLDREHYLNRYLVDFVKIF